MNNIKENIKNLENAVAKFKEIRKTAKIANDKKIITKLIENYELLIAAGKAQQMLIGKSEKGGKIK